MRKAVCCLLLAAAAGPAAADAARFLGDGDVGLDLRYRYESVEQDDIQRSAGASTLRLRLRLASGEAAGLSALVEADHVLVVGDERYDSTRNGRGDYPVVADPDGTDLNQLWLQYRGPRQTTVRVGRQRIRHDAERYVGAVGWRQNEQAYDALTVETAVLPGATLSWGYVTRVHRVFGPDAGSPPHRFDSDSHLLQLQLRRLPLGQLTLYGYWLDFDDAAQLSSATAGLRWDGEQALAGAWSLGWAADIARQRDAAGNPAQIDAGYLKLELGLKTPRFSIAAGLERLGGERDATGANRAFQTPLATLHRWQGWADRFTTTPPGGVEDRYVAASSTVAGFSLQAAWHDFSSAATGAGYGRELDLSASRRFAERWELLLKLADYRTGGFSVDTRKAWLQLSASF